MKPNSFLARVWDGLLVLLLAGAVQLNAIAKPPNVVILLADDQGWGDLGVNGNTNVKTPNIDSLARHGAVLERFLVCSVCAPTRAEFLTGRYHPRGGVRGVSTGQERLNTNEVTLADTLKAAGYATGAFGKWHNGSQWPYHPNARGFQEYYGFTSGHWSDYFDPILEHNGEIVRGKGFIVDDLTEHALAFIEQNRSRPFFCYLPFNTPHSPFQVPDAYWDKCKDRQLGLRAREPGKEDENTTRCVLAMTENLDWNVGRVLKKLEELKLTEETIVLYFSDNGPNSERWNGGMKGRKGSVDEGGLRVPCLIRWPGKIKPGTRIPHIAGAIDLLPTLASLTGVPLLGSKPLDGRDLKPLLLNPAIAWPERLIFSHQNGRVSVRTPQYRLDPQGALFDMLADPGQQRNVAPANPAVARRLTEAVVAWKDDVFAGPAKDDRPYPVGYPAFPWAPLPARDGVPAGGIKRSASAPNCSYFTNWRALEDTMTWDIEAATAGEYEVAVYYTCAKGDEGSVIEVSFNGSRLAGVVTPAYDPPFFPDRDRVIRKGESYMKEFKPLALGSIRLEKGRGRLVLRATEIKGKQVMDVRGITVTLRKQGGR